MSTSDAFADVMGPNRGTGGNSELSSPEPDLRARDLLRVLTIEAYADNFTSSFEALIEHHALLNTAPLLRELTEDTLLSVHCSLTAKVEGVPLSTFYDAAGLPQEFLAENDLLTDSTRLLDALLRALHASGRVTTANGLAKKLLTAWRLELLDIVMEAVFSTEEALWDGLNVTAKYRAKLPSTLPPLSQLVDRDAYSKLLKATLPVIGFERGAFQARNATYGYIDKMHDGLWQMVFAGLAHACLTPSTAS